VHPHVQDVVRRRRELARLISGRTPRRRINARLPRPLQPDTIRLRYFGDLRQLVVRARDLVNARIGHRIRAIADEVRLTRARRDASVRDVPGLISTVEAEYWDGFSDASAEALAAKYARATSDFQREQLGRQLAAATGVPVPIRDGDLGHAVDRFTARNVSLITSIPERYFTSIRNTLVEDVGEGARWEDIADDLAERFSVSESTANLIARDQVGKLYGALNQERQEELGITGFTWRTSEDNRVREEHVLLDGRRFDWDSPPAEGIPGEPVNCRCWADPDVAGVVASLAA
jgi:SPP1 gp7 family putative phage head morphogenesis protein